MIQIGEKSVAYINDRGHAALCGISRNEFHALSEEAKMYFPPHMLVLLLGRPLKILDLVPDLSAATGYAVKLEHEGGTHKLPYEHVSAIFFP